MDQRDLTILQNLLRNSRVTYRELAIMVGISVNAIHRRVQNLVDNGLIRGYTAEPNIWGLGGLRVLIFGKSDLHPLVDSCKEIGTHENVRFIGIAGGKYLFVDTYLKNIADMDFFTQDIIQKCKLSQIKIGIVSSFGNFHNKKESLKPIDFQILQNIKTNARKPMQEIAKELSLSTKTVKNHIKRMQELNLVNFSIQWAPEIENNIIFQLEITLKPHQDKFKELEVLQALLASNIGYIQTFSNIPHYIILTLWANSPLEMRKLYELCNPSNYLDIHPRIIYDGYFFETWLDHIGI